TYTRCQPRQLEVLTASLALRASLSTPLPEPSTLLGCATAVLAFNCWLERKEIVDARLSVIDSFRLGRNDPQEFPVRPNHADEMECANCADSRNGSVHELFHCNSADRTRSGNEFCRLSDLCFRSTFAERTG